jgi:hypothetical protein
MDDELAFIEIGEHVQQNVEDDEALERQVMEADHEEG